MTKRITVLLAAAFLLVFFSAAISSDLSRVKEMPANLPLITGEEIIPDAEYYPSMPGMLLSPGDTVGITQYDYQTNGSTGNRIVVDNQANIHVSWMKGSNNNTQRHVYFNCKTPTGWLAPGTGQQVSVYTGAGYTTIDAGPNDQATIFYHRASVTNYESLYVAVDAANCQGFFDIYFPPNGVTGHKYIWPYGAIDRNSNIHVVANYPAPAGTITHNFMYIRSTDGGATWTPVQVVDTLTTISSIVTASKVSDKVAIVYTHPENTTVQVRNDVYYILSNDGTTWDFRNGKVNFTEYGQGGDTLFAYTDLDAVFDYNDNLHIVWNAQYTPPTPANSLYYLNSRLMHYDLSSGMMSQIHLWPDTSFYNVCDMGGWNFTHAKMSIGCDLNSNLYVTYTSWDSTDCSSVGPEGARTGFANGDIYLHWSTDNGATWSTRVNLTNTQTPLCDAGDCESDHWSSLAEKVDTSIHLFYVNDKDAGGYPQTEGVITNNPMLYLTYVPPPLLGVNDDGAVPRNFTLEQNYPNPFNTSTNIEFELTKASGVDLSVYDITGARVATLLKGDRPAGRNQVNWDASAISSGIYYYTLRANGSEVTKKMTLLK